MPAPTGTLQTYQAVGIREDLTDAITRISPTATPFMSGIPKGTATNTLHEWQTQDLASAANNAQVEGDDNVALTATPTVRLNNRCQISTKGIIVSGTQQNVRTAGRANDLAYLTTLRGLEIKRDMELALCQNTTAIAGNATTARQLRGLEGWIATNDSLGAGGVSPDYIANTAPTDGTARAFTEALTRTVLQLIFTEGGDPNVIMVGPSQKQTFSTFTGNTTKFDKSEDKSLTASVDIYISDFGTLNVIPNRYQRPRTAFLLQMDKWALCYLRPMKTEDLAKTGDADKKMLVCEYTLESRQEKASGAVRDLT
jgi:hypothetical protein